MITCREATPDDAEQIAQLHSLSWQQNYIGIWNDEFLNSDVLDNRRQIWQQRLTKPASTQYVIVAEANEVIHGFACTYMDKDPVWGTLLDNLHVHAEQKGRGLGTLLIKSAAGWAHWKRPDSGFYLWVLPQNTKARRFYEKLGATNHELVYQATPDGGTSASYRYVWTDLTTLLD